MIAFCSTLKGRLPHLTKTLIQNIADNADCVDLKFILLLYNETDDRVREWLTKECGAHISSGRLVVYQFNDGGLFRMGHGKNLSHRLGMLEGADVLVNLDADNFTGPGFANWIADQHIDQPQSNTFLWAKIIRGQGRQFRGCSGRIAVTPRQFILAGGYDEKYNTYAPDDKDFNTRLQRLGMERREIDIQYLRSVPHKDGLRYQDYPEAKCQVEDYELEYIAVSEETVVNFGRFGCGTVYRNFDTSTAITIGPLPTRIFGIGMHKTATSSLHRALTLLGYDSAHWTSPAWARAVWTEMTSMGRSHTLERHYALSDLPIGVLYQELDHAYPGSKFILTIRDEQSWLESVRAHWDRTTNPWRASWDTDGFSHRLHTIVYGRKTFDSEVMLNRYRRHNAEVKQYFANRPGDLLTMHVGDGWGPLCGFLEQPHPGIRYPWENGTLNGTLDGATV